MKIGILGAAGYTGGELIRLLLNHPEAEIVFANSESNSGNLVSDVHEGLIGETELKFTDEMPFDQVDVVFFCFGHGKSEAFLKEHTIPENVKIIDLAQDFRIKGSHDSLRMSRLSTWHRTFASRVATTMSMVCRRSTRNRSSRPSILLTPAALPQLSNWHCFPLPCCIC